VPLGLKGFLEEVTGKEVTEMDWWQTVECGSGIKLVCLPAQHWSLRIGQPRNSTLWASFLLITRTEPFISVGTAGISRGYKEIGRRFPGIDTALLPITAYDPRWFMHYAHMNAEEAMDAMDDLGAARLIPTSGGPSPRQRTHRASDPRPATGHESPPLRLITSDDHGHRQLSPL